MSESHVSVEQLLIDLMDSRTGLLNTALPGIVKSFDPDKKTVSLDLGMKAGTATAPVDLPTLEEVPVIFPRFATGGIYFPLEAGDGGLVVFLQRDCDGFILNGTPVTPYSQRRYSMTDAVFLPGFLPGGKSESPSNPKAVELTHGSTRITIKSADGDIEIKTTGTAKVDATKIELGSGVLQELATKAALNLIANHVHPVSGAATSVSAELTTALPLLTTAITKAC